MMGESPTRPASLKARPEVVVVPEISPLSLSAEQWMVPVGGERTKRTASARRSGGIPSEAARASSRAASARRIFLYSRYSDWGLLSDGGAWSGGFQLGSAMPGPHQSRFDMVSFHNSQTLRE